MSLALSTSTRTLSLSMVGTSIGAAFASSTQENPPAADSAKPADIFNASRRLRSKVMAISLPLMFA